MGTCNIDQDHCEACGREADPFVNDGYSTCCNELIARSWGCRDHHGQEARYQAALDAAVAQAGFASRDEMIDRAGIEAFRALADGLPR